MLFRHPEINQETATMTQTRQLARARGFTLIELLIVVIILAVLAAIVVPQFANTTIDAKEATLDANLSAMRSAIEQYKVQHGAYPSTTAATAGTACATPAVKGTGAINTPQAFIDQMTMATDKNGNACSAADPVTYKFGPYLRGKVPNEPINDKGSAIADIAVATTGTPVALATTVVTGGWLFDNKSGQFVMNSGVMDSKGTVPYFQH